MRTWALSDDDERELRERWEAYYQAGELSGLNETELLEHLLESARANGFDDHDLAASASEAIAELLHGRGMLQGSIIDIVIDHISRNVEGLEEVICDTPVLMLPTLDYEAFAHRLHSGRPFVAVSLLMLTQPFLIATAILNLIDAAHAENRDGALEAQYLLTALIWHIHSSDHDLVTAAIRGLPEEAISEAHRQQAALSMSTFLILHELAHVRLQHRPTHEKGRAYEQEFEADALAFDWWKEAFSPREHWDTLLLGLFGMLHAFELEQQLGGKEYRHHPSWAERRTRVFERAAALGLPLHAAEGLDAIFGVIGASARKTVLVMEDEQGVPRPYGSPHGLLEAVDKLDIELVIGKRAEGDRASVYWYRGIINGSNASLEAVGAAPPPSGHLGKTREPK